MSIPTLFCVSPSQRGLKRRMPACLPVAVQHRTQCSVAKIALTQQLWSSTSEAMLQSANRVQEVRSGIAQEVGIH